MAIEQYIKKQTLIRLLLLISFTSFVLAALSSYVFFKPNPHRPFPQRHEKTVESIQEWMTIQYISQMYDIPPQVFSEKLQVQRVDEKKVTIAQLAKQRNKNKQAVIAEIKVIIEEFQKTHPSSPTTKD